MWLEKEIFEGVVSTLGERPKTENRVPLQQMQRYSVTGIYEELLWQMSGCFLLQAAQCCSGYIVTRATVMGVNSLFHNAESLLEDGWLLSTLGARYANSRKQP